MDRFKSLACVGTGDGNLLPLSTRLLSRRGPPPEKLGKLTLPDLVVHKYIVVDDDHPGYYFSAADSKVGMKGVTFPNRVFGMLINILQAEGPGATL